VFVSSTRAKITELVAEGQSIRQIAEALGLANNTVRYHIARSRTGAPRVPSLPPAAIDLSADARREPTRKRVERMLADGLTRAEIARRLGISKATVSYHARNLGAKIDERCARRYDWEAIQRYYDQGHSITQCQVAFGFARQSWHEASRRGDVTARPQAMPIEQLLAGRRNRAHVKRRLIKLGLKTNRCERCGLTEWRERPLSMALHHRNGDRDDNSLENLELLCPNCHSQTDTFSGRNGRRAA
jgi:DNA-binding CsgD family transcriptional regulator